MQVLNWTRKGAYSFWLATHSPIDLTQQINQNTTLNCRCFVSVVTFILIVLLLAFISDINLT